MAYITGSKEFWSTELMVSPATLVPRPETELLVAAALAEIPHDAPWRILDLGTGCGAIAAILARERPLADVTAIDQSDAALGIAVQNARQLDIGNMRCLQGDWTEPVRGERFDLIVSNPPYVCDADPALTHLQHEPRSALVAGPDGLQAIRQLARDCGPILVAGGAIMLEHGAEQEDAVADILDAQGWLTRECRRDCAGLPRLTIARKPA
jgi:release factor glutamine methyltransferase